MAEAELSVVIRLRDLLTKELKRLDGVLAQFQSGASGSFTAAARAADAAASSLEHVGTAAQGTSASVSQVGQAAVQSSAQAAQAAQGAVASQGQIGQAAQASSAAVVAGSQAAQEASRGAAAAQAAVGQAAQAAGVAATAGAQQAVQASQATQAAAQRSAASFSGVAGAAQQTASASFRAGQVVRQALLAAVPAITAVRDGLVSAASGAATLGVQAVNGARGLFGIQSGAQAATGAMDGLGRSLRTALLPILPFLTAAGAAFAALRSVQGASEFSRSISEIASISEDGGKNIGELRGQVLALSREFGQSPVDQARGLYLAISSGAKDAAEGVDILRNSTRLAIAGLASTEDTVDLITSALNAYSSQNLQAAEAADVLFKTVEVGKGRVEDLARNFGKALPFGSALNISFRELSATLATLSLSQGSVEQSATALRSVLGGLLQITDEQRKRLEGLGAAVDPASIKANGLVKTLVNLGSALNRDADAIREIFPDAKSLTGVLALVNDGGVNLNRVLDKFATTSGAVGRALDKQLADPARQLDIILNSVKVSFNEAFGAEFLRQTSEATARMGGVTNAATLVSDAAGAIGRAFATALPLIVRVSEAAVKTVVDISTALERALPNARAFGITLVASFEAFTIAARSALNLLVLVAKSLGDLKDFALSDSISQEDVKGFQVGIDAISASIDQIQKNGKLAKLQLEELRLTLRENLPNPPVIKPTIDESELREIQDKLKAQKLEYEVRIGQGSLSDLRGELAGALADFNSKMKKEEEALRNVFKNVAEAFIIPPDSIPTPPPIEIPIEVRRGEAEAQLAGLDRELAALQKRAFIVVQADGAQPARLAAELSQLGSRALAVQESINQVNLRIRGLREESAQKIELEIKAKTDELAKLETGLLDARSQAQLLGVDANTASQVLGTSFSASRVQVLRREISGLQGQLRVLSGATPVIAPKIDFDLGEILDGLRSGISRALDRVDFSKLGRLARESLRDGLAEGAGRVEAIDAIIDQFRGGVEPSLARQLDLIDKQVQRQRDATDQMRELGIVSGYVADQFDASTDALERSKRVLEENVKNTRLLAEIRASEVGIDVRFLPQDSSLDDIQRFIEDAQRKIDTEAKARHFGIELVPNFDETAFAREFAKAQAAVDAQFEEIQRSQVVREGLRFGVSLKDNNFAQLEADIAKEKDRAQAYLDSLGEAELRSEALRIGIEVEGVPVEKINEAVAGMQSAAKQYATQHPIEVDLLLSGIENGARAFAGIATGAKSAREAVADFFASMAEQAAYAIAKLLIVKTLISAFGRESAVGNFLAVQFGAAKGVAFTGASAGVQSYALGGTPGRVEREVKRYGTIVHEGLPERAAAVRSYGIGGVPHNSIVRSRQFAPVAEFGEAGPEAIVPLDGRDGVRGLAPGGTVSLPLARDGQGRLSVDLGGVLARAVTSAAKLAEGARPEDLDRILHTRERFELGGAPRDIDRVLRTQVEPYALGGVPSLDRVIRTQVEPYALGGVPSLDRVIRTQVEPYALGGVPSLDRVIRTQVEPYAIGGAPALERAVRMHAEPYALGGVVTARDPFSAPAVAARAEPAVTRNRTTVEVRPNITINVSSLDGQTAASVILREKETIASAVAQEISRSPLFRAHVRGDRA